MNCADISKKGKNKSSCQLHSGREDSSFREDFQVENTSSCVAIFSVKSSYRGHSWNHSHSPGHWSCPGHSLGHHSSCGPRSSCVRSWGVDLRLKQILRMNVTVYTCNCVLSQESVDIRTKEWYSLYKPFSVKSNTSKSNLSY